MQPQKQILNSTVKRKTQTSTSIHKVKRGTNRCRPCREALDFGKHKIAHFPLAAGGRRRRRLTDALSAARRHGRKGTVK